MGVEVQGIWKTSWKTVDQISMMEICKGGEGTGYPLPYVATRGRGARAFPSLAPCRHLRAASVDLSL